jgi:LPS O-antigen subunit length determinant protein (WzzB/FepE family)
MKKNSFNNDDEIDIFQVVKTIWDGKIKIALIIGISILVGVYYNHLTKETYDNLVIIKPSKNSQFTKFQKITTFLNESTDNYLKITNITILTRFIEELMDYEELMIVLKNLEKNNDNISELSSTDQQQKIFDYAKSFKVNKMENKPDYVLQFKWDNYKESIEIIDNILKLTLINFENSFFKELDDLLEVKKTVLLNRDSNRIDYLKEQSSIAKKLGIKDNQFVNDDQSKEGYFLRGFEAIDKEISLIQSREYKDFADVKKDINLLKDLDLDWVNYNSFLIETKSNKDPIKALIFSILIGLLVGVFYTLISNVLKSQEVAIK